MRSGAITVVGRTSVGSARALPSSRPAPRVMGTSIQLNRRAGRLACVCANGLLPLTEYPIASPSAWPLCFDPCLQQAAMPVIAGRKSKTESFAGGRGCAQPVLPACAGLTRPSCGVHAAPLHSPHHRAHSRHRGACAHPCHRPRAHRPPQHTGANCTYTIEAMMGDKRALQAGTSHDLGDNFAKVRGHQPTIAVTTAAAHKHL